MEKYRKIGSTIISHPGVIGNIGCLQSRQVFLAGLETYLAGLVTYLAGLVTSLAGLVTYLAGLVNIKK